MKSIVLLLLFTFSLNAFSGTNEERILKLIEEKQTSVAQKLSAVKSVQYHIFELEKALEDRKRDNIIGAVVTISGMIPTTLFIFRELKSYPRAIRSSSKVALTLFGVLTASGFLMKGMAEYKIKKLQREIKKAEAELAQYEAMLQEELSELEGLRASIGSGS